MKKISILPALFISLFLLGACSHDTVPPKEVMVRGQKVAFDRPKKSVHYESNTPAHEAILAGPPVNVVVDFNFDLALPSAISIKHEGTEYGLDATVIDEGNLALRRRVSPAAPDGLYTVTYEACWPDASCHDGKFQFVIDRTLTTDAIDLRDQKEVTVKIENVAFDQPYIRVSKGTKITWENLDAVEHTINTDPHAAHTYYPQQNSRLLKKGETYAVTFSEAGVYPYHCSPHASVMKGTIIVE